MKPGYLPKEERKKVMLLSDDMRFFSGIATMSREIVMGTVHHYNWVQIGGSMNHPDKGKIADMSVDINKQTGITDAYVKIYPVDGYGTQEAVRQIMDLEKPDMIMLFTDPRYWTWFFQMEAEVRSKIPVVYYSIWDDEMEPLYNFPYYASCDGIFSISKQSHNLVKKVLTWGDHHHSQITKIQDFNQLPAGASPVYKPTN
jgi:hypothetical protein